MTEQFQPGDRVICIETSILELDGFFNEGGPATTHKDVILSEKTILQSARKAKDNKGGRKKRIFVPKLEIERVMTSDTGEVFLSFTNGKNTPPKYRLYHVHPASRFRKVEDEEKRT